MDVGCSRTAALGSQLSKYSTKNSGRMLLALSTYRIPDVNAGSIGLLQNKLYNLDRRVLFKTPESRC